MERLSDPLVYANDPALAWKRVRTPSRKPEVLGRLKALAAWRELEARSKNLPRGRIMKDETLADVAAHPPATQDALTRVRGLSPAWKNNDIGQRLMDALAAARPLDASELPPREDRQPGLGKEGALVADLLKLLLKIRAREGNVAARLIARTEELEQLATRQLSAEQHGTALVSPMRVKNTLGDIQTDCGNFRHGRLPQW
jgi:ribonuclease D